MKKKSIFIVTIVCTLILIFVIFFTDKTSEDDTYKDATLELIKPGSPDSNQYHKFIENKDYTLNVINLGDKVKRGEGILLKDEYIYMMDSQNDQLAILDKDYNVIKKIGKSGNSSLEFTSPTGITSDSKGNIYILDSGNKRVQILNSDLEFIKEVMFKVTSDDPYETYEHIAVDKDNNIYLSGEVLGSPGIVVLNNKGIQSKIEDYFLGSIFSDGDKVYAINFGDMFTEQGYGVQNGKNFLMEIENKKLSKLVELPYGIGVLSFLINNDEKIIVDSSLFSTVTFIDMKGNYQFSLKKYPENTKQRTSHICFVDGKILLTNSVDGKLIEYSPKNKEAKK